MIDKPAPVGVTWFTNLSDFQVQAIEDLRVAIRDDSAEGTLYRTQFCFCRLGLDPVVPARILRKLIAMCRGSDLAFLYFLMEACYKGPEFDYSQQILTAGIMYLDLEMTMRELDKILPPGVDRLRSTKARPSSTWIPPTIPKGKTTSLSTRSPYFRAQPRPTAAASDRFICKPPCHVVTFPFWPAGERPIYRVNDENRWFADYKFNPVKRMLFDMMTDIMNDYFAELTGSEKTPMCKVHQEELRRQQLIKDEAVVKAHETCLALMDITARKDAALRKRIVTMLDKDIEDCTLRWQRVRQRNQTDVMLMEDFDQICSRDNVPTAVQKSKMQQLYHEADIGRLSTAPNLGVHVITGQRTVSRVGAECASEAEDTIACPTEPGEQKLAKCPPQLLGHRKPTKKVVMVQKGNGEDRMPECCNSLKPGRFFERARRHSPFLFHYHQIAPVEENPAPRDVMRGEAVRTLRDPPGSCCSSEDEYNGRLDPRAQVVEAIVECANDIWFGSLEAYQQKHADDKAEEEEALPCGASASAKTNVLGWTKGITHFDPDNKPLMERLLRDGFSILRKDPRCVFAALPNSHKALVMLEWVKRRYGKVYHYQEIEKIVQRGMPAFRSLMTKVGVAPSVSHEGFSGEDTFADVVRLTKQAKQIKTNYRMTLNRRILQLSRVCWGAMVPHVVKETSMINSFFAYLPVRYMDMLT
ncbi:hypothetical protein KR009_011247 [Drosophila setifemur]|nr:hypothetical protein KR009_011247 [Drosophila setifemur]